LLLLAELLFHQGGTEFVGESAAWIESRADAVGFNLKRRVDL
jgi:hypothetical protein